MVKKKTMNVTRKMLLAPHHGWLNMVKFDCRAGAENFLVTGDEMLLCSEI
jgi:hypothetical protein